MTNPLFQCPEFACLACGSTRCLRTYRLRDVMFRKGPRYTYCACADCNTLTLCGNIERYLAYPPQYFTQVRHGRLQAAVRLRWTKHNMGKRNLIGACLNRIYFPNGSAKALGRCRPRTGSRILDAGCGSGHFVEDLRKLGYMADGVDFDCKSKYCIGKMISDARGLYDVVAFNQSLEHMESPATELIAAKGLMTPDSFLIVRVPILGRCWKLFGSHWMQLDAPRHTFIPSFAGINVLLERCGFHTMVDCYSEPCVSTLAGSAAIARGAYLGQRGFPLNTRPFNEWRCREWNGLKNFLAWLSESDMFTFISKL